MTLMLSVSGCRGVVGETLTPEIAVRFAGSFGAWLRARAGQRRARVVLARDGRAGGEMIKHAAMAGLLGAGCDVVDLGIAMTPTVGFATDMHRADGGMVLTASHNPQQWNGLKAIVRRAGAREPDACAPDADSANQIIELFRSSRAGSEGWRTLGTVARDDLASIRHVKHVLDSVDAHIADIDHIAEAGFNVVLDSVNCSGAGPGRHLLESLGIEQLTHLGGEATGLFPHTPEPTRENLGSLAEAVKRTGADIGFAQDPDADRLAIVDERGEYIGEEYTLVLAAEALLASAHTPGATVAVNLSTSRMIDDVAARHGAKVIRTAVGEANVVAAMKSNHCLMGGEGNGGVIFPPVTYIRDSLSAMAIVLALMAKTGEKRPLSGIIRDMPAYAIEKRKVDLPSKDAARPAVDKIARAYKSERIDLQDGVRVDFEARRAWLHVRASNTEPIMRLIAEAPSPDAARGILDEAARVIAG
ncbi:MAG: phosphoglucosamine mutase [Phycisphaerales bacterium]|nr:phosphoglucosamine mutase [Phycisphaerales bacterium]